MMRRAIIMLVWMLTAMTNSQAQNNRYQLQPENRSYNSRAFIDIVSENLERAKEGHQQGRNQIWSDLERVNNYIKQGDYDMANLLIDRCIQLNAQWEYHLIDHSILIKKKNEIANAKNNASRQSHDYNNYSSNNRSNNQSNALNYANIPDCYSLAKYTTGTGAQLFAFLRSKGFATADEPNAVVSDYGNIEYNNGVTSWIFPDRIKTKVKSDISYFAEYVKNEYMNGNEYFWYRYKGCSKN